MPTVLLVPSTIESIDDRGEVAWTIPSQDCLRTIDDTGATVVLATGQESYILRCSNFQADLPVGAIDGIQVLVQAKRLEAVGQLNFLAVATGETVLPLEGDELTLAGSSLLTSDLSPFTTTGDPPDYVPGILGGYLVSNIESSNFYVDVRIAQAGAATCTAHIEQVVLIVHFTPAEAESRNGAAGRRR